jgi:hypothetical protein
MDNKNRSEEGSECTPHTEADQTAHGEAPHPVGRTHAADGGSNGNTGAPLSNTAPANCNDSINGTRILRTGVDSLYLSHQGQLHPEIEENLDTLKKLAQSDDPLDQAYAVMELHDHLFEVKGKGKGRFPFVLVDNWFHIQLSSSKAKSMPMAYTQIASEILAYTGVNPSFVKLNSLLMSLGEPSSKASVSRVDLCVDFTTDIKLDDLLREAWVRRAREFITHFDGLTFSGYEFGRGGEIVGRLYNKTLEIHSKSNKTFFFPIWKDQGWDGVSDVWRMEFQFRRTPLRELGIHTVSDLMDKMDALWEYATTSWLRLAIPSPTDKTKKRWPNHPLWDALTHAPWCGDHGKPLYRRTKCRTPSPNRLFIHGLGGITSFMAQEGISNFDEALEQFGLRAHAFHREYSRLTGKTLNTYAREKAQQKARRFNTRLQVRGEGQGE